MVLALLHFFYLFLLSSAADVEKYVSGNNTDSVAAFKFLHENDRASSKICNKMVTAEWNYATNLTEENKNTMLDMQEKIAVFSKETWKNATSFAWKTFKNDQTVYRWFKSLSILGSAALPEKELNKLNNIIADMESIYSTGKICNYNSTSAGPCTLSLEPDLTRILIKSRNYEELAYVWKAWRDVSGKKIKEQFLNYVTLKNEAAKLNGFSDAGDLWRENYESDTFQQDVESLWQQMRPFYLQLHAYVRRQLIDTYGCKIRSDGPIPAHLLGNMWGQTWDNILSIVQPFKNKSVSDVSSIMVEKKMTPLDMFLLSEEFFTSLGLQPMTTEFWNHSVIEKPKDREVVCHASAWDFCNGKDFRIKMCTEVDMEDLITIHHEMGHIQYYMQYANQPNVFRNGANPGFHEALGDTLALSVSTPQHLKKIDLLKQVSEDKDADINFLLRMALGKVAFLPFGYLIDSWRWQVFNGEIPSQHMNSKWWEYRLKYQGLCPPVRRTEEDFDPGAKYHVAADVPYIRYFVSTIIQFQFHKALCDAAGYKGPLYKCDIYESQAAGEVLSLVMSQGNSIHWTEAMNIMTGGLTNKMDADPLLEYFSPLMEWLRERNENEYLGWKSDDPMVCPSAE